MKDHLLFKTTISRNQRVISQEGECCNGKLEGPFMGRFCIEDLAHVLCVVVQFKHCYLHEEMMVRGADVLCCCKTPTCNEVFPVNGSYSYLLKFLEQDSPTLNTPIATLSSSTLSSNRTQFLFTSIMPKSGILFCDE